MFYLLVLLALGTVLCAFVVGRLVGPQGVAPGGWEGAWSPDGRRIAFLSNFRGIPPDLWVTQADGRSQRRLTTSGVRSAQWSANGRSIIVASRRTGVERWWQVDAQTGVAQPIWEFLPAQAEDVIPSPDGRHLAFVTRQNGSRDLWIIGNDGTQKRGVTRNLWIRSHAWAPDGRQLVFAVGRIVTVAIWQYTPASGSLGQLYGGFAGLPAISPDSSSAAFTIPLGGGAHSIVILNLQSGVKRDLKLTASDGGRPAWSPDGRSLVFTARTRTGRAVMSVSAQGGRLRQLSPYWLRTGVASWSPDGRRLLVEEVGDNVAGDLFTIAAADGAPVRLTRNAPYEWNPAWSPDGRKLAYLSDAAGKIQVWLAEGRRHVAIGRVLSADATLSWAPDASRVLVAGTGIRILSSDGKATVAVPPGDGLMSASWAPNGSLVAYTGWGGAAPSIHLLDLQAHSSATLTTSAAYPSWAPDSRLIAYATLTGLWVIHPDGTSARQVLALPPRSRVLRPPVWSADGTAVLTELVVGGAPPSYELWRVDVATAKSTVLFTGAIETEFAAFLSLLTTPPATAADRVYFSWLNDNRPAIWMVAPGSPPRLFRDRASSPAIAAGRLAYVSFTDRQRIVVEEMTSR